MFCMSRGNNWLAIQGVAKLTGDTLRALLAWQESGDCPALGPILRGSRKGRALTTAGMIERAITARVRELRQRLGIANLSAHDCRHYWAARATQQGTHPKALQQAGGWNSPAMVMHYININETEIANEGVRLQGFLRTVCTRLTIML